MPKSCVVRGCTRNAQKNPDLSFFRFPSNESIRKQWVRFVDTTRPDFVLGKWSYICRTHFTDDCQELQSLLKPLLGLKRSFMLKEDAVPTLKSPSIPTPKRVKGSSRAHEKVASSTVPITVGCPGLGPSPGANEKGIQIGGSMKRTLHPSSSVCDVKPKRQLHIDSVEAASILLQMSSSTAAPDQEGPSSADDVSQSDSSQTTKVIDSISLPSCKSENAKPEMLDQQTQTDDMQPEYSALKIENANLKNEINNLKTKVNVMNTDQSNNTGNCNFGVDDVKQDDFKCKFYTGLTLLQFICLWNFLGPAKEKLSYWNQPLKEAEESPGKSSGGTRKLTPIEELFLTLVRLRLGLLNRDLAYRFGISVDTVSETVTAWLQFMYLEFGRLRDQMFPSRDTIKLHVPWHFQTFKNVRVIVDCPEFSVKQAGHKHHSTYKCLVGFAPSGAVIYVSNTFEGTLSDRDIVSKSKFLDKLEAGDLVIADRGCTIRDNLFEIQTDLNVPPLPNGGETHKAEIVTEKVARIRVQVERAIGSIKKFRLLKKTMPSSLQPLMTQMVFVVGCLVNYQDPNVK